MFLIGGNGFATVYVSNTQEVRALNFYGAAPKRATVSLYQGKDYSHGFLSPPVPSCQIIFVYDVPLYAAKRLLPTAPISRQTK